MHNYHGEGPGRIDKKKKTKTKIKQQQQQNGWVIEAFKPLSCEGSKPLAFLDV